MDVVAEFKSQNPSLFSRGSAIPVTYNKAKSNGLLVPRTRASSANAAKRGVSLPLPVGFINGSHNLLASLNFQPSATASTNGTRFSPSEEINDGQDKNGRAGQGLGVQGNSSENTTTFSYPRSGPNRPLPQLKTTDNGFSAIIKPTDDTTGQVASKSGSAFTAPSNGQHQPVVLIKRPQSAIAAVNIQNQVLSAINRVNREREPVRQSSPLTLASLPNNSSNNKQQLVIIGNTTSTDSKDKDNNSELDNFLMVAEKDKSSLLAHSSSSGSTLPLPCVQNSPSVRIVKRVRFSEQLVAFEPSSTRGRLLTEASSRVARSSSAAEVKPILKYSTQMSSVAGIGNRNGQQQQQLYLQQQIQQQHAVQPQQNQMISLKNPATINGNNNTNNANINSNYLNSSPISTTINTINTMNNTLSNKNLAVEQQQQQQQVSTIKSSMLGSRSQSMTANSSSMPAFNPRDSLTNKSVEMIRRGMAGIAFNGSSSSTTTGNENFFSAEEQAMAMGMEEIKFDVNGGSENGQNRSSPITWGGNDSGNTSNNANSISLKSSDEKRKVGTGSAFPKFDMGKRQRPKSASLSASDNVSTNGLASLLTVSSNGNGSSSSINYSSSDSSNESLILFSLPAKAFSIGTMSCRAASPVQFFPSYMQFSFQPPFESSSRSILISYIDIQGMTLIGTKFRFKAPQRVLENSTSNDGNGSTMNGEKNYVLLEFISTMQIAILREKIIPMILDGQQQQQSLQMR